MMKMVVLLLLLSSCWVQSTPLPPACDDGRQDVFPESCSYGWTLDKCGHLVCLKGPGEMCGGKFGRLVIIFVSFKAIKF